MELAPPRPVCTWHTPPSRLDSCCGVGIKCGKSVLFTVTRSRCREQCPNASCDPTDEAENATSSRLTSHGSATARRVPLYGC